MGKPDRDQDDQLSNVHINTNRDELGPQPPHEHSKECVTLCSAAVTTGKPESNHEERLTHTLEGCVCKMTGLSSLKMPIS